MSVTDVLIERNRNSVLFNWMYRSSRVDSINMNAGGNNDASSETIPETTTGGHTVLPDASNNEETLLVAAPSTENPENENDPTIEANPVFSEYLALGELKEHPYNIPDVNDDVFPTDVTSNVSDALAISINDNPDNVDTSPEEADSSSSDSWTNDTTEKRVRLVKSYAWVKEEMNKSTVDTIADYLHEHPVAMMTECDIQTISETKQRRYAAELLLKRVLMGPDEIYDVFASALDKEGCQYIAERLSTEQTTDVDIQTFITLDNSSLKQCSRPRINEPRLTFSQGNKSILKVWLNNRAAIDAINDNLLSRLIFSIDEHTNIADSSLDTKQKVCKLIETMELCSEKILEDFREILDLESVGMAHVIRKLDYKNTDRHRLKRHSSSSMEDISESASTSKRQKLQSLGSSKEFRLVKSMQRPDSNIRKQAEDKLGFVVDSSSTGSITIQLSPKAPNSWSKLKASCRSNEIKDFIPEVYRNNEVELDEGEYMFNLTIYILPTPPYSQADNKVIFHLSEGKQRSKGIEQNTRLLCDELEITDGLLALLENEKLVDAHIKDEIRKQGSRRNRTKYLLEKISVCGEKGYDVLKEYIKGANEELYKDLVASEGAVTIGKRMSVAANVRGKPPNSSREVKKEVFFTATVVIFVKKNVNAGKRAEKGDSTELEITCPNMIDPVCHFEDTTEKDTCTGQPVLSDEQFLSLEEGWRFTSQREDKDTLEGKRKQLNGTERSGKKIHKPTQESDSESGDTAADEATFSTEEIDASSNSNQVKRNDSKSKKRDKKTATMKI